MQQRFGDIVKNTMSTLKKTPGQQLDSPKGATEQSANQPTSGQQADSPKGDTEQPQPTEPVQGATDQPANPTPPDTPPPVLTPEQQRIKSLTDEKEALEKKLKDKETAASLNQGLMTVFNYIYKIIGYGMTIIVILIFILASIDLLKYLTFALLQIITLAISPNVFNKDTVDVLTLLYFRNNIEEEPFSLYAQQTMVSILFKMANAFIIAFLVQMVLFIVITVWFKFQGVESSEKIDITEIKTDLVAIAIGICAAYGLNAFYNARFLRYLQPQLKGAMENVQGIKNFIYDNVTTNSSFLASLTAGNITECANIMNQQTNINTISRMIFSMSLYNFYRINISENEDAFATVIRKIFTPREVELREVNPIDYMYYNQNVFIPNMYPLIRKYIYGTGKAINSVSREKALRDNISYRINEVNKRLMYLFKIPAKRDEVRNYIYYNWLLTSAFMGLFITVYRETIIEPVKTYLIPFFQNIFRLI